MDLILNKKKFIDEDNLKTIVKTYLNFNDQISALKNKTIDDYDSTKIYAKDDICYHDNYIWRCQAPATGAWNSNRWEQIGDGITELTKADVEAMLGLSAEEVETMAQIILDTEVRLDKTYSSSKIYTDILQCLTDSKTYTLEQIGKASGASYRVVSITGEMTDEKIIYLLDNGTDFDMYILDEGVPTKIGNTAIDLSDYYTKTDIDDTFLTKAEATSTYATIATLNGKIDKTSIVSAVDENSTNEVVVGGKLLYDGLEAKIDKANIVTAVDENSTDDKVPSGKLLYNKLEEKVDKANIVTTIDSTSTDEQIPSAKVVYDSCIKDNNIKTYTSLEQLGLNGGCDVAEIVNAMPEHSYAEIGCYNTANSYGLEVITGLPNGEANFILTIRKYNYHRVDIQAKSSASGAVMNDLYIGGMVAGGTSISWKKVCSTSVEDVALTSLTYNEATSIYYTLTSGGIHSHYIVKNGICYVDVDVTCVSTKTGNWSYVFTGLPIPTSSKVRYFSIGGEDGKSNINGIMDLSGRIGLMFGTAGVRYVASFSYPVAES